MINANRWLLSFAVLLELIALSLSSKLLGAIAGAGFIFCFLLAYGQIQSYSRIILLVSLTVMAWFGFAGKLDLERTIKALADAAFYATFLGSLGVMQCLVKRFEVLRRIHDILLGGPTIWLYPKYAIVSCGIASVLSFGVMNLLCGSLPEILKERNITGPSRILWLRSILLSTLRGFSLVPLVAPTSVAVAIITRELPQLSWYMLLPYGLVASVILIIVGWILEQHRFSQISSDRVAIQQLPEGSLKLLGLILVVFSIMTNIVIFTDFKVSTAAMFAVPSVTLMYMLWQEKSIWAVLQESTHQISKMNNEMTVFAASAIIGVVLSNVIPSNILSGLMTSHGGMLILAVCGLLILPVLSAVGIAPITVLSVIAGLLPQLISEGMDALLISTALVIGFSLAMMLSPYGPSVMLLSRFGKLSPWVIAFRWNGVFVLIAIPALLLLITVIFFLLPTVN